jgi:hypothetical protein
MAQIVSPWIASCKPAEEENSPDKKLSQLEKNLYLCFFITKGMTKESHSRSRGCQDLPLLKVAVRNNRNALIYQTSH